MESRFSESGPRQASTAVTWQVTAISFWRPLLYSEQCLRTFHNPVRRYWLQCPMHWVDPRFLGARSGLDEICSHVVYCIPSWWWDARDPAWVVNGSSCRSERQSQHGALCCQGVKMTWALHPGVIQMELASPRGASPAWAKLLTVCTKLGRSC